jgi:hypothetical protein
MGSIKSFDTIEIVKNFSIRCYGPNKRISYLMLGA